MLTLKYIFRLPNHRLQRSSLSAAITVSNGSREAAPGQEHPGALACTVHKYSQAVPGLDNHCESLEEDSLETASVDPGDPDH